MVKADGVKVCHAAAAGAVAAQSRSLCMGGRGAATQLLWAVTVQAAGTLAIHREDNVPVLHSHHTNGAHRVGGGASSAALIAFTPKV